MIYQVTQEDIDQGVRADANYCAISLAMNRLETETRYTVDGVTIHGFSRYQEEDQCEVERIRLMPDAIHWTYAFDKDKSDVMPCKLVIYQHPMDNRSYGFLVTDQHLAMR